MTPAAAAGHADRLPVALPAPGRRQPAPERCSPPARSDGHGERPRPPGAGSTYRDGGLLIHLDLPTGTAAWCSATSTDKVIPGWFDKGLPWRRGDAGRLRDNNCCWRRRASTWRACRAPSCRTARTSPLPPPGDDDGRERYWRQAMAEAAGSATESSNWSAAGLGERLQKALD